MSFSQLVKESFQAEFKGVKSPDYNYQRLYRERMIEFRKPTETIVRVEKRLNIPRARELGYKGRRPKRTGVTKLTRRISIQGIAEKRTGKKFPNCEVLNSYFVGEDGKNKYFEVILVDTSAPEIIADREINWITGKKQGRRAERGKTSAQRKSRGLKRGEGHEKNF